MSEARASKWPNTLQVSNRMMVLEFPSSCSMPHNLHTEALPKARADRCKLTGPVCDVPVFRE
jgi:hypothetical protein